MEGAQALMASELPQREADTSGPRIIVIGLGLGLLVLWIGEALAVLLGAI